MKVARFKVSMAIASAIMLSGCAGVLAHKGAVIDPQLATSIQPGVDNKASVEKLLGRPSFTGQFNQNDWYYLSRDTKQIACIRNLPQDDRAHDRCACRQQSEHQREAGAGQPSHRELIADIRDHG